MVQSEAAIKRQSGRRKWISTILFLLPRIFVFYPFYILPSFLAVRFTNTKFVSFFLFFCLLMVDMLLSSFASTVSITAFLLSFVLQTPFLIFIFQFPIKKKYNAIKTLRLINIFTFIFSIGNMVQYGFPFKLPYINFAPDFFSALYGQGGAKIVTLIGFFGFVAEIYRKKADRNRWAMILSFLNFIVPNYLIGMIMGFGALILVAIRKNLLIPIVICLVGLIILPYALDRYQFLNSTFSQQVGYNPKVFAYVSVGRVYSEYPITVFTGTGLGQFTSTPALWASKYISALSTHEIPNVPGLFMSGYHDKILGPILSSLSDDAWSLSSSANKPYTSASTVFAEYGLVVGIIIVIMFISAFNKLGFKKRFVATIFFFVAFLFCVDLMHDDFWLGFLLILSKDISIDIT